MDRQEIVSRLESLKDHAIHTQGEAPFIISLDEGIAVCEAIELLKEQPEIVRCEDCKHRPTYPKAYGAEINGNWCYWCELHRSWKTDDWFCADGERR